MKPSTEQIIDCVSRVLRNRHEIAAAYLLGSAHHGRQRDDSDIDIALLPAGTHRLSMQDRLELGSLLEVPLGTPVDLGVITPGNLPYASEAILNGRRIVTADPDEVAAIEARLLGCYLQYRQDRREVEEAYHAT